MQPKCLKPSISKINNCFLVEYFNGSIKMQDLSNDLPATEAELYKLEQFPLLDIEYSLTVISDDKGLLRSILTSMVATEIPADKLAMDEAHRAEDWELVEKLAHRMKGGFLYCGTRRLVYAAQYLERYHKAGHRKELEGLYQQFMMILDETVPVIQSWLEKN